MSFNVEVAGLEIIVPANITVSTDAGYGGCSFEATDTTGTQIQ
jgi:hypothetical protein